MQKTMNVQYINVKRIYFTEQYLLYFMQINTATIYLLNITSVFSLICYNRMYM